MILKNLTIINIMKILLGIMVYAVNNATSNSSITDGLSSGNGNVSRSGSNRSSPLIHYEKNIFLNGAYKMAHNDNNNNYNNNNYNNNNNNNNDNDNYFNKNITLEENNNLYNLALTSLLSKRATPFVGQMYLPTLLDCRDAGQRQKQCVPKAICRDGYFSVTLPKPIQNCIPEENTCCIYKPPPPPPTTTTTTTTTTQTPYNICNINTACVSQRDCRNGEILSQTVVNLQTQKCYEPKVCCNIPSTMLTEDGYVLKTPPNPFIYPSYKPTVSSGPITTNQIPTSINNEYLPPIRGGDSDNGLATTTKTTTLSGGDGRQGSQGPQRPSQAPYRPPTDRTQNPYQQGTKMPDYQSQTPYRPQIQTQTQTQTEQQQRPQTTYRQPIDNTKQSLRPQIDTDLQRPTVSSPSRMPSTEGEQMLSQVIPQTPSRQPYLRPTILPQTPAYLPPTRRQRPQQPQQPQQNEIMKDRYDQPLSPDKKMVLRGEDQLSPQIFPTAGDRFNNQLPNFISSPMAPASTPASTPASASAPALAPALAPVKCASALLCTDENYCNSIGVISETPVELKSFRVPLTDCLIEGTGAPGKCCRDPNYVDPWPVNLAGVCAQRNKNTKPQGVKDIDANFAEIPWQAMILKESSKTLLCGGTIIGDGVVLTTASCVDGVPVNDVRIKAGEWELGSTNEPLPFQLTSAKNIALHPNYNPQSGSNDMAVIHLMDRLQFASHIQPICINDKDPEPTETCITTGWGKQALSIHEEGAIMHVANTNILSRNECNADNSGICAATNFDICQFDAGSALACGSGKNVQLKGIFSMENACGEGQVARFTKPDIAWVNKQFLERSKPLLLKA